MTNKEAIGVIKFEIACVNRQEDMSKCDRRCGECDLCLPTEDVLEAYDLAIKALEQVNQAVNVKMTEEEFAKVKGDLISREWLEDAFDNLCCHNCKMCRNFRIEDSFYKCALINNAPTVELRDVFNEGYFAGKQVVKDTLTERPHGKWVGINEYINHLEEETGERYKVSHLYDNSVFCNHCWSMNGVKSPYCPNCGADMRGEENGNQEDSDNDT